MLVVLVVAAVAAIVGAPVWKARSGEEDGSRARELAVLEARKEAKYREIRDAEMDLRTGKLSVQDHRALDRALRAEAVEILEQIDRLAQRERRDGAEDSSGPQA